MRKWWGWALLVALAFIALPQVNSHLTTTLRVPGSASDQAQRILQREFGEDIEGTFTVIYHFKNATAEEITGFKKAVVEGAGVIPGARVVVTKALGGFFFATIQTPYQLPEASSYTIALRKTLATAGLDEALVGGPPAIKNDVTPVLNSDLARGEIIGVILALCVLIALLGFSSILFIPVLTALFVTSISLALVYLFSLVHPMALYLPNIITLIALGLSIDYSLLVIYRYRSERRKGASHQDAVTVTTRTATKTASVSASLVALSLIFLLLIDVPFIRSITLGTLFVPLICLIATSLLVPLALDTFAQHASISQGWLSDVQQRWTRSIARMSMSRPIAAVATSVVVIGALASVALHLSATPSSLTSLPASIESKQALTMVSSRLGDGVITPHVLIIESTPNSNADLRVENSLRRLDDVVATASERKGSYFKIYVISKFALGTPQDQRFVQRLRNMDLERFGFSDGQVYVAGAPAQGSDLLSAIGSKLPWIIIGALLALFLALTRYFASLVLAAKALLMDSLSLVAVIGGVVALTHFGIGTYKLAQVEAWSLLLTLTILFGLSMDYEIFIVSRIREAHDRGVSDIEAITEGIEETSVVVTAAALILIAALSGFVFGHFAGVQQLGLGLLIGIAIDVTIVRLILLPATMVLLGKWNWWQPSQ